MKRSRSAWILLVAASVVLLQFSGCAVHVPKTIPLAPDQQQEASALLTEVSTSSRPLHLDADIRLVWDILGSKGGVAATIQIQPPVSLRFSANDPLGRPLYIVVSQGDSFIMADNRKGTVVEGATNSKFWHTYVPESVTINDLFLLLGGMLPLSDLQEAQPSQDAARTGFWYVWTDELLLSHHVLLDKSSKTMSHHLLYDRNGDLIWDVSYTYGTASGDFVWPRVLTITGATFTGTLTVQTEQVYPHSNPLPSSTFHLVPPPHFVVERVD